MMLSPPRASALWAVAASVVVTGITSSTVASAQMSSSKFVPVAAEEKALYDRAARDVFPRDVRDHPGRYAETLVLWTGVTDGSTNNAPVVEHHYFDGVVEGGGGVWLSPWGDGRFCLLDVSPKTTRAFASDKPLFVRAYGYPVVTDNGLCLRRATVIVGDRGYTTTIIEYGPNGGDFSEQDAAARGATHSHPEERLLTRFGYRVLAGVHAGKTNLDDSAPGVGWSAAVEVDLRLALRTELGLLAGPHAYPEFGTPTSIQTALLFRYYVVGIGAAFGPLLHLPVQEGEQVWIGGRYMPMLGDALGAWRVSPAAGGSFDIAATTDGDVRFLLALTLGIDGNLGAPPSAH
jgi:hypothetical protein